MSELRAFNLPSMKEKVFSGDLNDRAFSITPETFERMLKLEGVRASNAIALYSFYCYKSKYQKNNRVWATIPYVATGLQWGEDRVKQTRADLKELGLIEDYVDRSIDGQWGKTYVKVNYLLIQESRPFSIANDTVKINKPIQEISASGVTRLAAGTASGTVPPQVPITNTLSKKRVNTFNLKQTSEMGISQSEQKSEQEEIPEAIQETPTFAEFMERKGYSKFSYPTSDDCWSDGWGKSERQKLSDGMLKSMEREYKRTYKVDTDRADTNHKPRTEMESVFMMFASSNPAWTAWRSNKTQRESANYLLDLMTVEKIRELVTLTTSNEFKKRPYAPQVDSPHALLNKLAKIKDFIEKSKGNQDLATVFD